MKHIGCFATQKEEKAHLKRLKGEEKYEALNEMIASCRHIAFFGGAGVSTESGIPDFRSKDGLYNQHDVRFDAYQPEYLLSNPCLEREPKVFYEFYRQKMDARGINPNKAHYKLAEMEAKGKLDGVITQNIDGLHQLAGSKVVYEVHGSTLRNYCDRCGKKYPSDAIYEYPASSLVSSYSGKYLVIVNRDKTSQDSYADLAFHDSIGEVFSHIVLD